MRLKPDTNYLLVESFPIRVQNTLRKRFRDRYMPHGPQALILLNMFEVSGVHHHLSHSKQAAKTLQLRASRIFIVNHKGLPFVRQRRAQDHVSSER